MTIKKILSVLFICVSSLLISVGFLSNAYTKPKPMQTLVFEKGSDYSKLWKRVDSLTNKGLTKSALEVVNGIYTLAKKENNAPQFVKAIMKKMKLESQMEEFSLEKSIYKLNTEIAGSKFPVKPVIQSILADAYWSYYQNNRWKFLNRSTTVNFKNDDVSTWTLNQLLSETIKNYRASLESADSLKRTPINIYDEILNKGTTDARDFRPTLYDFLANRALDFYESSEADVSRPANRFSMNDSVYYLPAKEFSTLEVKNPDDTLNLKYYALRLYQDLLAFHLNDAKPEALIDADLNRLSFINSQSKNERKDSLYLRALHYIAEKHKGSPSSAEALVKIGQWYASNSGKYSPLKGDEYKWFNKTAIAYGEKAITLFPESYGAKLAAPMLENIKRKALSLTAEDVNEPGKPARTLLRYNNVSKVYFRVIKSDYKKNRELTRDVYGDKLIKKYTDEKPVASFEYDVPDDKDYNSHTVEAKIPELPVGFYTLLASTSPTFSCDKNIVTYTDLWYSDIAYTSRKNKDASFDISILHRQTGEALANVKTTVWMERYDYKDRKYKMENKGSYTSDKNGSLNIPFISDNNYSSNFYLEFNSDKDYYYSDRAFYAYKPYEYDKNRTKTFFFTDRGIYRPGQTVHFKAIHLSGDGTSNKLLPNTQVYIQLRDVNYQTVTTQTLTTNEYGTVSGSFVIPQGLLNGNMNIMDNYGSTYFSVEEYKRPKFEATFEPVKGSYKLNEEVTVTGTAKAFAGYNIDGADVSYRVVRNVSYPGWWYWYRGYYGNTEPVEIMNGVMKSNDTGAFEIKFKAFPDPSVSKKEQPTYNYTVYADVTDLNGETHSAQTWINVGYKSLNLSLSIPEETDIANAEKLRVSTTNLNGVDEAAQGKITMYALNQPDRAFRERLWQEPDKKIIPKEEYYKLFPYDKYEDETNKYKWTKEKQVAEFSFDTKTQKEIDWASRLKEMKPGVYVLEAICKDKFGEEVKDVRYVTLYSTGNESIPEKEIDWLKVLKDKGEPGEKASYILASALKDLNYKLEIEHGEVIVASLTQKASMKPVEITIEEGYRGNFVYYISFLKNNRFYSHTQVVTVPYTNKELDISFETFRNKLLPGQEEEWKMIIKNKKGEKETAELLAAMYDASLDEFRSSSWYMNIYDYYYSTLPLSSEAGLTTTSRECSKDLVVYHAVPYRNYDHLNNFGMYYYSYRYSHDLNPDYEYAEMDMAEAPPTEEGNVATQTVTENKPSKKGAKREENSKSDAFAGDETTAMPVTSALAGVTSPKTKNSEMDDRTGKDGIGGEVKARSNFSETAFFFPQVQINEKGEYVVKFTVPESLTKWKFKGFAHTKDLKYGQIEKEVQTQKDLMVQPNAPRFLRENDKMTFTAKVVNLSDKELSGTADLLFYDALTDKEISSRMIEAMHGKFSTIGERTFSSKKGQSALLEWNISIPEGIGAIKYKVVAKAGNFTDGEEMALPVLTNSMLVTESMPLPIRSKQTKDFTFQKLISQNNNSTTLRNHKVTLEFTANPAWYAVQSLPYLIEYPYECSEQTFSRYYANSLASHIVNSKPKIKQIFESWKQSSPEAFFSNLQKNQELKSLMLEETPWVLQAKSESENKKRVALLFDLNTMSNELTRAMNKLQKMQVSNGGWPWFEGGPDDWYITQHIVSGMGHLDKLGVTSVRSDYKTWSMVQRAAAYCDDRIREEYEEIKKYDKDFEKNDHLSYMAIDYLYARSYFTDVKVSKRNQKAVDYFTAQAKKHWLKNSRYMQGMIALALHRNKDLKTPKDILKSLKENALYSEEMGMYWKENYEGFYWYEAPIESQALLIEAFDEINGDQKSVDELKTWLLKSKQTQNWGTTKATTEAVYALLLRGTDWLSTEPNVEITVGSEKLDPKNDPTLKAEAGTGYFKKTWSGSEIKPEMGNVKVSKKDEGVSWGAIYWQYFEQLDKITPHATPLKLTKKLFLQQNTKSGPVITPISDQTALKPGDKVKVRIELKVDRDMQYVHMKDMRASCFEPLNVFSQYKWQDGLGYYESTKDASTNFFFSSLRKGSYVFEYTVVVTHFGNFSNGITTIQCMYAPEFTSHSEGIRVKVMK
ncbi:MAG: hypothetical protein K0S33_1822 [Bacteroidetes bacterium]|jgi:uncharacterized protein YfaS (alpha-2-macroglobulin family)|nr:hypothetical protein [Bacteroidota bacterium]